MAYFDAKNEQRELQNQNTLGPKGQKKPAQFKATTQDEMKGLLEALTATGNMKIKKLNKMTPPPTQ